MRRLLVCPTKEPDDFICVKINLSSNRQRMPDIVTYKLIQQYVEEHYGFKVHTAYVAEVKRKLGLPTYPAPNAVARRKYRYYSVPQYKEEAIIDALNTSRLLIKLLDGFIRQGVFILSAPIKGQ